MLFGRAEQGKVRHRVFHESRLRRPIFARIRASSAVFGGTLSKAFGSGVGAVAGPSLDASEQRARLPPPVPEAVSELDARVGSCRLQPQQLTATARIASGADVPTLPPGPVTLPSKAGVRRERGSRGPCATQAPLDAGELERRRWASDVSGA